MLKRPTQRVQGVPGLAELEVWGNNRGSGVQARVPHMLYVTTVWQQTVYLKANSMCE